MAQYFKQASGGTGEGIVGSNSLVLAIADPVSISTAGFLALTGAGGERILGWSVDSRTMAATNQTVALVQPLYLPAHNYPVVVISTDTALAVEDRGEYKDIGTSATGAFVVAAAGSGESLTGTTTAQLLTLGRDPDRDGTNTLGVFMAAQPVGVATGAV